MGAGSTVNRHGRRTPSGSGTTVPAAKRWRRRSSSTRPERTGLRSRLLRVFFLQLFLIALVTVAGVTVAGVVAERVLVAQGLVDEAAFFWAHRSKDPAFAPPNTRNLHAWFQGHGDDPATAGHGLPEHMRELHPGQHRVDVDGEERIVLVSEHDGERLVLLYAREAVESLAFWFGIVPLAVVLLVMYTVAFVAYWLTRRAIHPVARLAERIRHLDLDAPDAAGLGSVADDAGDADARTLTEAIGQLVGRARVAIERERNFTRYASHELRTPIAVIGGSAAQLALANLDGASGRAVARIERTARDMGALVDDLLLLARERSPANERPVPVPVNLLTIELARQLQDLEPDRPVRIAVRHRAVLEVRSTEPMLAIVIGNLLRNAWRCTREGEVRVTVDARSVTVCDDGPGLDEEQQRRIFDPFYRIEHGAPDAAPPGASIGVPCGGHGLGLALVRHVLDVHGWTIRVHSAPGRGARFRVDFNGSVPDQLSAEPVSLPASFAPGAASR